MFTQQLFLDNMVALISVIQPPLTISKCQFDFYYLSCLEIISFIVLRCNIFFNHCKLKKANIHAIVSSICKNTKKS